MSESEILRLWHYIKNSMHGKRYYNALKGAYNLILELLLWAGLALVSLPFLLPACLIMLVAKFQSRKE